MPREGFGLSLPNRGLLFGALSVGEMLELAERAEDSGMFGSVWVGDGLIAKPRVEAITSLAAIAGRTRTLKLGTCCMATFVLRHPVLFACQWASLDVLSEGRSLLAVCLGAATERGGRNIATELAAMGMDRSERVARFEEGIDLVRALWAGPTAWDGRFWSFPEVDLEPKPVQQPCPVWIASNPDDKVLSPARYAAAIDRVGRLADGWMTTVITPDEFGRRWNEILVSAQRHGRDPDTLRSSAHLMINIDDDADRARLDAKRFLDKYYMMDTSQQTMDRWGAYGTPEQVVERLAAYQKEGLDLPILRFASFDASAQMDRALTEVLPELARR